MIKISKILSSLFVSITSIFASNVDIFVKDNKIQYSGSIDSGIVKNIFIYKNGRYIQAETNMNGVINDTASANYQVIFVINNNGKTEYVSVKQDITLGAKNIAPSSQLELSLSNTILNFSNAKSSDSDGNIVQRGFYIYDSTGKCIKVINGSSGNFDFSSFSDGKYQIISWVIDNAGDKSYTSEFFNIDKNKTNYTLGKPSEIFIVDKTNKEYYSSYSFHDKIGSSYAYAQGWTGAGVKVAVLDSGIDYNHIDLKDNIIGVYSTQAYSTTGYDDYGHGTMVAGVIAAEKNDAGIMGVAYDADIISIKVLNNLGKGSWAIVSEGVKIATQQNAKVANLSLGGTYTGDTSTWIQTYKDAVNSDTSLVIAAGNNNTMCTTSSTGSLTGCSYPAALPLLYPELLNGTGAWIVVGSVDKNGNKSSYSNSAGLMKDFFIVALGGNVSTGEIIYSTKPDNSYGYTYGTSLAAPMVTGAFALLAQKYPYLKGADIRDILFVSATDLGTQGVDEIYGHGELNIQKAMQPIGTLNIPTTRSLSTNKITLSSTSLTTGSAMSLNMDLSSVLVLDSYNRAFNVNIKNQQNENYYSIKDFKEFELKKFLIGLNEEKQTFMLGYNFEDIVKVKLSKEDNVFGSKGSGATKLDGVTYYGTLESSYENLTFSLTAGYSNPEVGGLFKDVSSIKGLGADINYKFGNFKIGFETPMRVLKGSIDTEIPTARASDSFGEIISEINSNSLKGSFEGKVYFQYEIKI